MNIMCCGKKGVGKTNVIYSILNGICNYHTFLYIIQPTLNVD